jgi:hypothetical protein
MYEGLYYIPLIARALQEPDVKTSLRDAFSTIERLGRQERYSEGFQNFELFMDAAYCQYEIAAADYVLAVAAQLATGGFEDGPQMKLLLDIIRSEPEWLAEYEAICRSQVQEDLSQSLPVIRIIGEKGPIAEQSFSQVPGRLSFDGILPGNYVLELVNTGWIIWEGALTAKELIWSQAYPDRNLPLAAETTSAQIPATSEKDLLGSKDVVLRTYAGIESGRVEIELTR